jgi:hypothetical protein
MGPLRPKVVVVGPTPSRAALLLEANSTAFRLCGSAISSCQRLLTGAKGLPARSGVCFLAHLAVPDGSAFARGCSSGAVSTSAADL